jgi:thioredoxin reductase (NADPH)
MYDTIIVGGGPAGLTAGIYSARYLIKTLVLSENTGGQILETTSIENYPGFINIGGMDLANKFKEQYIHNKGELIEEKVENIEKVSKGNQEVDKTSVQDNHFIIKTNKNTYEAKSIILTIGSKRRKLNVKGEKEFLNKGVGYCATCDAALYRDLKVAVVGSGNASAEAALLLAQYATDVTILIRKEKMKCEPILLKQIEDNKKISIKNKVNITEIKGDNMVNAVDLDNGEEIKLDGVFIEIGFIPDTTFSEQLNIELDEKKYIKVNAKQATNVKGVFAAGDITDNSDYFAQITTAQGEATVAAQSVFHYIKSMESEK